MGKITTSSSFVTQKLRKDVRIVVNEWPIIGDNFGNSILLQRLELDHKIEKQ
jgi:hypothetical protein